MLDMIGALLVLQAMDGREIRPGDLTNYTVTKLPLKLRRYRALENVVPLRKS